MNLFHKGCTSALRSTFTRRTREPCFRFNVGARSLSLRIRLFRFIQAWNQLTVSSVMVSLTSRLHCKPTISMKFAGNELMISFLLYQLYSEPCNHSWLVSSEVRCGFAHLFHTSIHIIRFVVLPTHRLFDISVLLEESLFLSISQSSWHFRF